MTEEDKAITRTIAKVIINELKGLLKKHDITVEQSNISPGELSFLCRIYHKRRMNKKQLVAILEHKIDSAKARPLTEEEQVFVDATALWMKLYKYFEEHIGFCGVTDSTTVS